MTYLGSTRSARYPDHILQTPDTFIRASLPGMQLATAVVHASPAIGARFTEYTAEMEPNGSLGPCTSQRFLYVIDGGIDIEVAGRRGRLEPGGYAYISSGAPHAVRSRGSSRIIVIEKQYDHLEGVSIPASTTGRENDLASEPVMGDPDVQVRTLVPADSRFDFAVNTMTFQPGASLAMVEMHVMEHGLLMLEGGGIYRLNERWYPVSAGDFIWMGPYCPQWFGAIGKVPAKYLIYKDWNRHPLP